MTGPGRVARVMVVAALACGRLPDAPAALPRVERVEPQGTGVAPALAEASVTFTAKVSPEGLVDGRRMVLAPAAAEHAAVEAVESEAGASGLAEAVPARITLEDGGRRAVLTPSTRLHALMSYVLVVGSRLRAADGRAVLDAEGRQRATVASFQTGPAGGPPARAVLGQVRVDAATPQAAGEYLLVVNRGEGPLDLYGHRLEKRSPAGAVGSCTLGEGEVAPGALAFVAGGAYDQRYQLPVGTVVLKCGTTALLGGLADDRTPDLRLLDPTGAVLSTVGAAGGPVCAILLRADLDGPDEPDNWVCAGSD